MADILFIKNNPLIEFVSKSIEMGAYEIEKLNTKMDMRKLPLLKMALAMR